MERNILITGGAGYIGSHLCLTLLENNFSVTVLDSEVKSSPKSLERVMDIYKKNKTNPNIKFNYIKGDLRDSKLLDSIFKNCVLKNDPIYAVIHLAGLKSANESLKKPLLYWDNNVNGILKLLDVMNKNSCNNLIFSSSATIYGSIQNRRLNEKDEIKPINPYGFTKAISERILEDIYNSSANRWKIINLRYFNPIGAHHSGMIGECSKDIPSNIFPHILLVANGKSTELKIFGNDWETFDGTGIRDYIHVMDLADAHLSALLYLTREKKIFNTFNIGTGKGTSVLELVNTFQEVNKCKIPFKFSCRRNGDVAYAVADNSLAGEILGWYPKRSLRKMCKDGWLWNKLNPNGFV